MKRHIKDLVTAPSEQSARLVDLIARARIDDTEAAGILAPFDESITFCVSAGECSYL